MYKNDMFEKLLVQAMFEQLLVHIINTNAKPAYNQEYWISSHMLWQKIILNILYKKYKTVDSQEYRN